MIPPEILLRKWQSLTTKLRGAPLLARPATEGSNLERRVRTDQARQRQDRGKFYAQDGCQFRYAVGSRYVSRKLCDATKNGARLREVVGSLGP